MKQITLIGLDRIGASIGMALREEHSRKYTVIGYDSDQDLHARATKIGAVDNAEWNLDTAVRDADIVVISTPVSAAYEMLENIAPYLKLGATVTDTCNTKRSILHWAEELLPARASFVGGHPLVNNSNTQSDEPSPYLFVQSSYAVVPLPTSSESAVQDVRQLCGDLRAKPIYMDAAEHDSFSAAVEGVPALVAAAVLNAASNSPSWHEISKFVGKDFISMSQPMANDPAWINGMAVTNRDMLTHWIDQITLDLGKIKVALQDNEALQNAEGPLSDLLVNGWENRLRLELGIEPEPPTGAPKPEPLPSSGEATMSIFTGRAIYRLFRDSKGKKDPTKYDRRKL